MDQREILRDFIQNDLLPAGTTVSYDEDLLLSGLVNSLGVMRLVAFVQDELGIKIPPEDVVIEHFTTIDALANYLQSRSTVP